MALVLVVEDDSILAYVLERVLTKAGHDVIGTAASFAKAVSIAASVPPELALVDFHLSGPENGTLVAHRLRQLGTKIIYVTANAEQVRLIDGSAEIVAKPFKDDVLLKAVERVIASTGVWTQDHPTLPNKKGRPSLSGLSRFLALSRGRRCYLSSP
jgi:CheY-like chemotaxis protein